MEPKKILKNFRRQPTLLTQRFVMIYHFNMRIVGVDPGETSGITLVVDREIITSTEAHSLHHLFAYLGGMKPDILVVEDFITGSRYRKLNAGGPLKAIGVCKLYSEINEIEIVLSNPSKLQGKTKPRGMSPHIWSAQVHALGYKE